MELTIQKIQMAVEKAFDILTECCPSFVKPKFETIKICNRASAWAYVRKKNGKFYLNVSKLFETMTDEDKFNVRLVGTMIHEIIHTQNGCFDHKSGFKRLASQVNTVYPQYEIQRCNSSKDWGANKYSMNKNVWTLKCNMCGKEYNWLRKPKYLEVYIDHGSHGNCKGKGFTLITCPPSYNKCR